MRRWDKPSASIANEHEKAVATPRVESLREAVPTLVPTAGANRDIPAALAPLGSRFHLDPDQATVDVRDQVVVRAVEQRLEDREALSCEPDDR